MDKTPLGGGAMVGLQLVRHWPQGGGFETTVLGSGAVAPAPGVRYLSFGRQGKNDGPLVGLSELQYARFCRRFEAETTEWLLSHAREYPPGNTCVIVNDISEGPTLARLAARGYPVVSLWHVDVVDYFNKLYLRNMIPLHRLTGFYEKTRAASRRLLPDLLNLIFEKQRETVVHSRRMIFPSRMMAQTVERCYGAAAPGPGLAGRAVVVPWGVWPDGVSDEAALARAKVLRGHFQLSADSVVLMTLSRISPEKGLHLLLKSLRFLENEAALAGKDICLFVCGEPAFMQGASYGRRVKKLAASLRRTRVFFPGYLAAEEKRAYLEMADLFISPSIHESYGLNIVEAMQAGKPVLASDHYGVRDLLSEEYGRVVNYGRLSSAPRLLNTALRELLSNPAVLKSMGRRARAAAHAMPFSAAAEKVLKTALEVI